MERQTRYRSERVLIQKSLGIQMRLHCPRLALSHGWLALWYAPCRWSQTTKSSHICSEREMGSDGHGFLPFSGVSRRKKQEEEGTHLFSRLPSSPGVMARHQQGRLLFHGLLNANAVTRPPFQFWWAGSIYYRLKVWPGHGQEIERDEIEKGWSEAGTVI